jgi:hypothetical protein
MYHNQAGNGVVPLFERKAQPISIVISDYHGNESRIDLWIKRTEQESLSNSETFHAAFKFDKANFYSTPELSLLCPSDALFYDANLIFAPAIDSMGKLTEIKIGEKTIPIKQNLVLHINKRLLDTQFISKAVLIYKDHRTGKDFSAGASEDSSGISISLPYLGLFELNYDSISPIISPKTKFRPFSEGETINFRVKDNFEVIGLARELRISQWLDDQWIVGNFDLKSNTLTIPVQKSWPPGAHMLKIEAKDDRNNTSVSELEILIN